MKPVGVKPKQIAGKRIEKQVAADQAVRELIDQREVGSIFGAFYNVDQLALTTPGLVSFESLDDAAMHFYDDVILRGRVSHYSKGFFRIYRSEESFRNNAIVPLLTLKLDIYGNVCVEGKAGTLSPYKVWRKQKENKHLVGE